jgi:acyl-CoA synthetase (AMP-forming)/AMP-acid ligase II
VLREDGSEVAPGSGEMGMVAISGVIPDGYYKDEAKTAKTFRSIGGTRYSFPGDWATVEADGSLVLLGRGSQCINTGGEKVFPEEVEEAVKRHPAADDCLIFGVPDERFGQRVVGVVSLAPGATATAEEVIASLRGGSSPCRRCRAPRTARPTIRPRGSSSRKPATPARSSALEGALPYRRRAEWRARWRRTSSSRGTHGASPVATALGSGKWTESKRIVSVLPLAEAYSVKFALCAEGGGA